MILFNKFMSKFKTTNEVENSDIPDEIKKEIDAVFINFIKIAGGKTFENGLYRVYRGGEIRSSTNRMTDIYSSLKGKIIVFAYDWAGRQFAIDKRNVVKNNAHIIRLDVDSEENAIIPFSLTEFHNKILLDEEYLEAALSKEFFLEWKKYNSIEIKPTDCVGYIKPPLLGGEDVVENLQLIDMDVYLQIASQILKKVMVMKNGQKIQKVSLNEE